MPIEITDQAKARIFASLQLYVREEFGEELGILRTERLYRLMLDLVGATVYNQAVADAQAWLVHRVQDMEGDLHEPVRHEG